MKTTPSFAYVLGVKMAADMNKIEVEGRDPDGSLASLLAYLAAIGNIGHSFSIDVDPDNKEYRHSFGWDGDGADYIDSIKVDGKMVKWDDDKKRAVPKHAPKKKS